MFKYIKNYPKKDSVIVEEYMQSINPSYSSLNEADKQSFTKDTIAKIFQALKNKSLKVNYMDLESCNGDITKFSKYNDLEACISFINRLYKTNPSESPIEANNCAIVLELLKKYKTQFSKSFSGRNALINMTFTNIAAALISGTAKLVSSGLNFIKDPNAKSYRAVFIDNCHRMFENDTYFKSLEKFIKMEKSGDLNRIFAKAQLLDESLETLADNHSYYLAESIIIPIAIIAGLATLLFMLKDLVYTFFHTKKTISDKCLAMAYFLEMDLDNIDNSNEKGQKVYEKQQRLIAKLRYIGEALISDQKSAQRKAEDDKDTDKEKDSSDSNSDDGGVLI